MPAPRPTLEDWLGRIERLHPRTIELGLERVHDVAARMAIDLPGVRFVVGGTNGKGSTCAMLERILRAAGYRVGRYGSPHLLHFNERALVDGRMAGDEELVASFERVESARGATSLTYFEFTTLAVLDLFSRASLEAAVLEIGLGGRLDAVNIVDADCAILTSVDLDHTDLLGATREAIGFEKAAIFRPGRPAVCADPDPPASVIAESGRIGATLRRFGREFRAEAPEGPGPGRSWNYRGVHADRLSLPWPALRGPHQIANAAGALAALEAVADRLPVTQQAVREGLRAVELPGRFQVLPGRPVVVLDVGHNPHAARALARTLRAHGHFSHTRAVFGMLRDKDARSIAAALAPVIDHWHLAPTAGERGRDAATLRKDAFEAPTPCTEHASTAEALQAALSASGPDDRILVFGSFLVVAEALRWLERDTR